MKRFSVVLILVGGLAFNTAAVGAEVIRVANPKGKRSVNEAYAKVVIRQPAEMTTPRGERFQQRSTLSKRVVFRKSSLSARQITRRMDRNSSTQFLTFPVSHIGASVTR